MDAPGSIYWKNSGRTLFGVSALGKDDVWAVVNIPLARNDDIASALSGVTGVHGALWTVGWENPYTVDRASPNVIERFGVLQAGKGGVAKALQVLYVATFSEGDGADLIGRL